jgi:beta-glucanase (GH16 family)
MTSQNTHVIHHGLSRATRWLLSGVVVLGLAACGGSEPGVPDGDFVAPVVEFQVVFEDDFEGTELDTSKWSVDEGDGCPDLCGWGNNESQIYSADNITVANGVLQIEGRQEADGSYTSGRINTKGKFDFRYGRVEVSARLPEGQGAWPAAWLLHSDPDVYGPWPASGEIDIVEGFNLGVNGNTETKHTTHYGIPTPPFTGTTSAFDNGVSPAMGFREYAIEWERDRIRFFVDGEHFQTQNSDNWYAYFPADDEEGFYDELGAFKQGLRDAPFDQLFHLIINFAIGGNPVGAPDPAAFPQVMEIDYVRVYECVNANPETGRGCGTGSPDVVPLEDNDGNALEALNTDQPYVEELVLYDDGPETIEVDIAGDIASNAISAVVGFDNNGATTVINEPNTVDPEDAENTLWRVAISGGTGNVLLTGEDQTASEILDTGFDFSGFRRPLGGDPYGEVAFEMEIVSMSPGAQLFVKLDSGFPNVGEFLLPEDELAPPGERRTYSVKFDDLLANPGFVDCCGGTGVDLENVRNPFVFEVQGGDAEVLIDNVRVTNACKVVGACGAGLKLAGIPDLVVYDDAVNFDIFDRGIVASDGGSGFVDYTDGTNPANKVNWAEVAADDPARGQVIEVTFNDSNVFGVWFIGSSGGVDISAYAAGAIQFDIKVLDYGTNTTGMTFKVDCFFPCTSGDKNLGVIADGEWETVTFPISQLLNPDPNLGLDLENVNTGIVVFPTSPQTGGITFRVDNIRYIADSDVIPLSQVDLPVTFEDPTVDYSFGDFNGAVTSLVVDPTDANNTVASTTKGAGAATFAGTVIGAGGFANPIPFAAGDTTLSVEVYSPRSGVPVLMKVENADGSLGAEVLLNTTLANQWETLSFDMSTSGNTALDLNVDYVKAIIFFDFGQNGDDSTYLWDNVVLGTGTPPPLAQVDLPVTFDDPAVDYQFVDFNGTASALDVDPDDANNTVVRTVKGAGAATFAGTVIGDGTGFANPIPFEAGRTTMQVRVYSPAAGIPVLFKVENADGSLGAEVLVNTTVANQWETLSFDMSTSTNLPLDLNVDYVQAIIFFDFGTDGNDAVYLWDDVALAPLAQVDLPVTFDQLGVDYTLIDFNGTNSTLDVDPDDANNTVARTVKGAGAATFAGTVIGDGTGFANPIPFAAGRTTMQVRVYSPAAGIPVLFKVETAGASLGAEVLVNTTVANQWEILSFDMSTSTNAPLDLNVDYIQAIIFFDFGTDGNDAVYLWDDVELAP